MLTTRMAASCRTPSLSHPFLNHRKPNKFAVVTAMANKRNPSDNSRDTNGQIFPPKVSNKIIAQSAVGVFALGFIDAGYSGDWSRIGVISKEGEDLLKAAAFIVVPLCMFLVFSLSKKQED